MREISVISKFFLTELENIVYFQNRICTVVLCKVFSFYGSDVVYDVLCVYKFFLENLKRVVVCMYMETFLPAV